MQHCVCNTHQSRIMATTAVDTSDTPRKFQGLRDCDLKKKAEMCPAWQSWHTCQGCDMPHGASKPLLPTTNTAQIRIRRWRAIHGQKQQRKK